MIQINKLWILGILILFSSCYTVKRMNTQVVKGYNTYPIEFTQTVSNLLPVKEKDSTYTETKYIPGDTIKITKFIKADCDTIVQNSDGKKIVYLQGVDNYIHGTITKIITNTKTIEDTKKITAINNKLNQANISISSKDTTIKILTWSLISIGLLGLLYFFAKKIPILNKFL